MKYCKYCGKELNSNHKTFCNSSCSASYNNKLRKLSKETKEKIKRGVIKYYSSLEKKDIYKKECVICHRLFLPKINNNGRISTCKTCSKECSQKLRSQNGKLIIKKMMADGRYKSWQTRNITSYPENFWINVLNNNNIKYIREDFQTKKYFLDFLIEKNGVKIDLEIDGKQHNYPERKLHDSIRDEYLKNLGYVIYRISWNSINTKDGKDKMEAKINNFIKFYNSI